MKTLELKHLAPYLPYGLRIKDCINNCIWTLHPTKDALDSLMDNEHISLYNLLTETEADYKPILRPLSDLTKEIDVNGEKFMPTKRIFGENMGNPERYNKPQGTGRLLDWEKPCALWKHYQLIYLFEWHFDVFNLISEGLAIDINTI